MQTSRSTTAKKACTLQGTWFSQRWSMSLLLTTSLRKLMLYCWRAAVLGDWVRSSTLTGWLIDCQACWCEGTHRVRQACLGPRSCIFVLDAKFIISNTFQIHHCVEQPGGSGRQSNRAGLKMIMWLWVTMIMWLCVTMRMWLCVTMRIDEFENDNFAFWKWWILH